VDHPTNTKDPITHSKQAIMRSKVRLLNEALNGLVVQVSPKAELGDPQEHQRGVMRTSWSRNPQSRLRYDSGKSK
jgi:hypothetical protein